MAVHPTLFPPPQSTVGQEIVVANEIAFAAAENQIAGLNPKTIRGRNSVVGTTEEDLWFNGGVLTWLQSAVQMDIVSSDATDNGVTPNTGAQTLVIEYLDSSFVEQTQTYTLNGMTNVTTAESMLRINYAYIATCGTYHGSNVGNITIRATGGGAIQANIEAGKGETQKSHYTVPAGKNAKLIRLSVNVDSAQRAEVLAYRYENADDVTTPFTGAKRILHQVPGIAGDTNEILRAFENLPPKTDIWWAGTAGAGTTDIQIDYDLAISDAA